MTSAREWWRRATAAVKDRRSICLTKVAAAAATTRCSSSGLLLNPDLEAAVIRATSHDERAADRKSAARVLAWARASPALLDPLMWALARRAGHTRSWAVAIKALILAHGLLLFRRCAGGAPIGRLPFDLSDFRDRSAQPARARGFSAFVQAYFHFLDRRSVFLLESDGGEDADDLERVGRLQELLDLLMQIRPYADGMEIGLVLEAMDCVVIEIFDVYSGICSGIAGFLVGILRPSPAPGEKKRRRGVMGIRALRKSGEQSTQLAAYFELCRGLGVMKAAQFPAVESIPEEDIVDLEKLVMGGSSDGLAVVASPAAEKKEGVERREKGLVGGHFGTVVTKKWVVFEVEPSWEQMVHPKDALQSGGLIELM